MPSPPPDGEPGAGAMGANAGETPHGFFEVILRLNQSELSRTSFYYPAVSAPNRVILDGHSESATSVAWDATFDLSLTAGTIVKWGPPVREGQNVSANVTVDPMPERTNIDNGFPGPGTFSHRFAVDDMAPGIYRFELRVNGAPAGHAYFRHPLSDVPTSPFEAWLERLLVRPVWEPVPDAGSLGDLDGDSFSDVLEYALGSDPLDASSRPGWQVRILERKSGQEPGVEFTLIRRRNVLVDLEHSGNLLQWEIASPSPEILVDPVENDPEHERLTLRWFPPADHHSAFFRLKFSEGAVAR